MTYTQTEFQRAVSTGKTKAKTESEFRKTQPRKTTAASDRLSTPDSILFIFPILIRGIQINEWRSAEDMVKEALLASAEEIAPALMDAANTPQRRQLMVNLKVLTEEVMGDRVQQVLKMLRG